MIRVALMVVLLLGMGLLRAGEVRAADPLLVAVGDIASCSSDGDEATAALLAGVDGTIATLGDTAYERGTAAEFANCFDPSWGKYRAEIRPATGNHEYATEDAAAYFAYFGDAAGAKDAGYYSYDLGAWHIVVINSTCSAIGGCAAGSPQETWLRADLAAHASECTLAYWHHPLFSSGSHGAQTYVRPIWRALYESGADVVLNGHDHLYERFRPQTPDGTADLAFGLREFVVGTGGRSHYPVSELLPTSEAHNTDTFGVLELRLHDSSYDWQFVPVAGSIFTDSGSTKCHGAPESVATPSAETIAGEAEPVEGAPDEDDVAYKAANDPSGRDWAWSAAAFAAVVVVGGGVVGVRVLRRRRGL